MKHTSYNRQCFLVGKVEMLIVNELTKIRNREKEREGKKDYKIRGALYLEPSNRTLEDCSPCIFM